MYNFHQIEGVEFNHAMTATVKLSLPLSVHIIHSSIIVKVSKELIASNYLQTPKPEIQNLQHRNSFTDRRSI